MWQGIYLNSLCSHLNRQKGNVNQRELPAEVDGHEDCWGDDDNSLDDNSTEFSRHFAETVDLIHQTVSQRFTPIFRLFEPRRLLQSIAVSAN